MEAVRKPRVFHFGMACVFGARVSQTAVASRLAALRGHRACSTAALSPPRRRAKAASPSST